MSILSEISELLQKGKMKETADPELLVFNNFK